MLNLGRMRLEPGRTGIGGASSLADHTWEERVGEMGGGAVLVCAWNGLARGASEESLGELGVRGGGGQGGGTLTRLRAPPASSSFASLFRSTFGILPEPVKMHFTCQSTGCELGLIRINLCPAEKKIKAFKITQVKVRVWRLHPQRPPSPALSLSSVDCASAARHYSRSLELGIFLARHLVTLQC